MTGGDHLSSPTWHVSRPDSRPSPTRRRARSPGCLGRHVEDGLPGYLSRVAPLGSLTCALAAPSPCALPPPGTLTRRRCGPPPSSPHHRRGAVQELRKEVRSSTASLVDVPVHHTARSSSPELRRRSEPRRRIVRRRRRFPSASAALDRFDVPRAAHRCKSRADSCPGTLVWVSPVRAPPLVADRRRSSLHAAARRTHASTAVRSGSNDSDRSPAAA
jgi:hypothetical protein